MKPMTTERSEIDQHLLDLGAFSLIETPNRSFRFTSANEAALEHLDCPRTSVVGKALDDVVARPLSTLLHDRALDCIETGQTTACVYAPSGTEVPTCYVFSLVATPPNLVTVSTIAADTILSLPEILSYEQRLTTLGRVARAVAHDANNLLTSVQLSLDALGSRTAENPSATEHLTLAQTSTALTRTLLKRILDFSSAPSRKWREVQMRQVMSDAVNLARPMLPRNVQFRLESCPNPGLVFGDRVELLRVVVNLLLNAISATRPNGGVVTASVCEEEITTPLIVGGRSLPKGTYVCLCVADSGRGMSEEELAHAFEPHFTTGPEEGRGLGLSIVKQVVQAHHGAVAAHSYEDTGTAMLVYLPAYLS